MKLKLPVNRTLAHFGVRLSRLEKEPEVHPGNTYPLNGDNASNIDVETRKLLNLVAYTTTNEVTYNGREFLGGYQTLRVNGHEFRGERDPIQRLQGVPFDFTGATVLDLGCNQGGMLLTIADRIKAGVGVDYDPKMINAATRIKSNQRLSNLDFYVFDLDKENLSLLENFIPGAQVDIVFMLSLGVWVRKWKKVVDTARSLSDALLFESHGTVEQRSEQEAYVGTLYNQVVVVREKSTDDPTYTQRRLLLYRAVG